MTALAQPYIESFALACAAFSQAQEIAASGDKDSMLFARNVVSTGSEHLRALARRYSSSREARDFATGELNAPKPIASDAEFRRAAQETADLIDAAKLLIGAGAPRLAAILKSWASDLSPTHAMELATIADTVARISKKAGSR